MKRVIMLKGLQGSGKSTWAREQVEKHPGQFKIVSTDALREMLDAGKWSKANEKFMLKTRDTLILLALQEGHHVIVDAIHLHPRHEPHIRELVKGQATVEIQDFTHVPLEVCIERDLQRPHSVGEQVIRQWYRDYIQPKPQPPVYDPALPDAIICDLDGTLALLNGRNPYDASECEQDALNQPVADILNRYNRYEGFTYILFVSGRQEKHREQAERWLYAHDVPAYAGLYMRASDDQRKDVIIKREIYEQHIAGKYNVRFALDDRKQCVDLWRELGLVCLQVADGDF